jgi:hypothetical protein
MGRWPAAGRELHGNEAPTATPTNSPAAAAAAAHRGARRRRVYRAPDDASGKAEDARGPPDQRHPPEDLLLLNAQALGCEDSVGFGVAVAAQRVHEGRELGIAGAARRAIGQMFGDRRIERLAGPFRQVRFEQPFFLEVRRAVDHGCPPSRPRSLRAARNR